MTKTLKRRHFEEGVKTLPGPFQKTGGGDVSCGNGIFTMSVIIPAGYKPPPPLNFIDSLI